MDDEIATLHVKNKRTNRSKGVREDLLAAKVVAENEAFDNGELSTTPSLPAILSAHYRAPCPLVLLLVVHPLLEPLHPSSRDTPQRSFLHLSPSLLSAIFSFARPTLVSSSPVCCLVLARLHHVLRCTLELIVPGIPDLTRKVNMSFLKDVRRSPHSSFPHGFSLPSSPLPASLLASSRKSRLLVLELSP